MYSKQNLGSFSGIADTEVPFTLASGEVAIYERAQNVRVYERFKPAFFQDADGQYPITGTVNANGILCGFGTTFATTATYKKASYTSRSNAYIPMYFNTNTGVITSASGVVTVALNILLDVTYGLVPGLPVYLKNHGLLTWINAGVVGSVNANTISIINSAAVDGAYDGIAVGIAPAFANLSGFTPASTNAVAYLYDADANFHNGDVVTGDVINLDTYQSVVGTPQQASVTILSQNLLQLAVTTGTAGDIDHTTGVGSQDLVSLFGNTTSTYCTTKAAVTAYSIYGVFGFTKKYDTTAITVSAVSQAGAITFSGAINGIAGLSVNDIIWLHGTFTGSLQKLTVTGVLATPNEYAVSAPVVGTTGNISSVQVWDGSNSYGTNVVGSVYADYRAAITNNLYAMLTYGANYAQLGVSVRNLAHFNDIKQCVDIAYNVSKKDLFFVLVDPTDDPATAYAKALAVFAMNDIYEVICASDEVAVQALVGPHCLSQADPYTAHERIGIQSFNKEDAYLVSGYNSGVLGTTGILTVSGANMSGDGVGIGDVVEIYVSATDTTTTANVIGNVGTTTLHTDFTAAASVTGEVSILAGTSTKQAKYAGDLLSGADTRRVASVFPCSFQALINGTWYDMPSYFLAAAVAGKDAATKASQDQTKLPQTLPWTVKLGTNFSFPKPDLDVLAGHGVYVFIQDTPFSSVVKCRDDLTTDVSALEFMYRSITKQVDKAAKFLRSIVDPYVGPYNIEDSLLKFLNTKLLSPACRALVKDGIVKSCVLNSVTVDPDVVNRILINITVTVFVAGKYFQITLNVVSK